MEDVRSPPPKPKREPKPKKEPKVPKQKKPVKRFGAYLRLYGPKDARTHAKLVLGHEPRSNTPEAFLQELEAEEKANYWVGQNKNFQVVFKPHVEVWRVL
jgi:hypothetical protein